MKPLATGRQAVRQPLPFHTPPSEPSPPQQLDSFVALAGQAD